MSDPRFEAFVAPATPSIFQSVLAGDDVWRPDPLDVPIVHREARESFERMIEQMIAYRERGESLSIENRMMVLTGGAGTGKTHLMRAFRRGLHGSARGFFAYLQMGVNVTDYPRYILHNVLESLSRPYHASASSQSSLEHLSRSLLAEAREAGIEGGEGEDADFDPEAIAQGLADGVEDFATVEPGILAALLHMRRGLPSVTKYALNYLRCEDLSPRQRSMLGGLPPMTDPEAPPRVIGRLADIIATTYDRPLIVCVDQLDLFYSDDQNAGQRFRTAVATLEAIADNPNVGVILSVLDDYYVRLREALIAPQLQRLEGGCRPVHLAPNSHADQIAAVLERRLAFLYEFAGVEADPDEPLYPFFPDIAEQLAGPPIRVALQAAHDARERSRASGERPAIVFEPEAPSVVAIEDESEINEFDIAWNDFRFATSADAPVEAAHIEDVIEGSVRLANRELGASRRVSAELVDGALQLTIEVAGHAPARALIALTNQRTRFGRLARELRAAAARADELGLTPIFVRTEPFPNAPRAQVTALLNGLRARGARTVTISDLELRTLVSLRAFDLSYGLHAGYDRWLARSKPITSLPGIVALLDLDGVQIERPALAHAAEPATEAPATDAPATDGPAPDVAETPRAHHAAEKKGRAFRSRRTEKNIASLWQDEGHGPSAPAAANGARDGGRVRRTPARNGERAQTTFPATIAASFAPVAQIDPGDDAVDLGPRPGGSGRFALDARSLRGHAAILGSEGSGVTTLTFALMETALALGVPALVIDRNGEFATYASSDAWRRETDAATERRRARLRDRVGVALYTPGEHAGRSLSLPAVPAWLDELPPAERDREAKLAAAALGSLMPWKGTKNGREAILSVAIATIAQKRPGRSLSLDDLIAFIDERGLDLLEALGKLDAKLLDKVARDLEALKAASPHLIDADAEPIDVEHLLGIAANPGGKTRLSILNTAFLGEAEELYWVSRFASELARAARRRSSAGLDALIFFNDADAYLPAAAKSPARAPLEQLLACARDAGFGIVLASHDPGNLDYSTRDEIGTWLVGRTTQPQALRKLIEVFGPGGVAALAKVPQLRVENFYGIGERGGPVAFAADLPAMRPGRFDADELIAFANAPALVR